MLHTIIHVIARLGQAIQYSPPDNVLRER